MAVGLLRLLVELLLGVLLMENERLLATFLRQINGAIIVQSEVVFFYVLFNTFE